MVVTNILGSYCALWSHKKASKQRIVH